MLTRIMRWEGGRAGDQGRLSCVDCALQAPRWREIHSSAVCGDPMGFTINMVIGSDDCFGSGTKGRIKKKPPPAGIAGEPYLSRDKHRQKHQRRKVVFYNPRILLIIISAGGQYIMSTAFPLPKARVEPKYYCIVCVPSSQGMCDIHSIQTE